MTDNIPAVIALAIALASPVLVWLKMRSRTVLWRDAAGLFVEVFATIIAAAILTRYAANPALHLPSVRLP